MTQILNLSFQMYYLLPKRKLDSQQDLSKSRSMQMQTYVKDNNNSILRKDQNSSMNEFGTKRRKKKVDTVDQDAKLGDKNAQKNSYYRSGFIIVKKA